MNEDEVLNLFDELLKARREVRKAEAAIDAFHAEGQISARPTQVESVDEWLAFGKVQAAYDGRRAVLHSVKKDALRQLWKVEREIKETLPPNVWFRHWDVGIAKHEKIRWGPSGNKGPMERSVELLVEPWCDEMPEL